MEGSLVTGTFRSADQPEAPPGQIRGQLAPDGESFSPDWTFPAGPEEGQFGTWLALPCGGQLLVGYRWTDDTEPVFFAAPNSRKGRGALAARRRGGGRDRQGGGKGTPGEGDNTTGPGMLTVALPGGGQLEIVFCEEAPEGQPRSVGVEFAASKTLTALVRFRGLPAGATLRGFGRRRARL